MTLRKSIRLPALAAFAAATLAAASVATPAIALDDGDASIFDTVKGLLSAGVGTSFGLGGEDDKPRIEYRDRAPLVLPPANQLPPPVAPVSQRNPAWPKDYDSERRRRAAETASRNSNLDHLGGMNARDIRTVGRISSNGDRSPGRAPCRDGDFGELCNPTEFWRVMKTTTSAGSDSTRDLTPGVEPQRKSLVEPPVGFRKPAKSVKYTFEVREEVPINDPRAQLREERRQESRTDR